ncbi:hypothetical protein [Mycobacterium antarcticum]|uniref:hypothetical protein n=1 Tax=unclassified Mycolicibacterium TaxID=2636767 RepID=UPI0024E12DAD|nr:MULTISPECIES: hypothetical protein [unclassified Mycolicibacterium]
MAVTVRKPRTRYTVGREAALVRLVQFLPDRTVDRILAAALRPHYPKNVQHHIIATAAR